MTACPSHLRSPARAAVLLTPGLALAPVLLALGLALSGCAGMSDGMTAGFADPARYDLYDCKQLEPERKALARRETDLEGLMAKADKGTAGPLVAEMAYRNELVAVHGQQHFAEEAWRKNNCHETPPGAPAASATVAVKPAPASRGSIH